MRACTRDRGRQIQTASESRNEGGGRGAPGHGTGWHPFKEAPPKGNASATRAAALGRRMRRPAPTCATRANLCSLAGASCLSGRSWRKRCGATGGRRPSRPIGGERASLRTASARPACRCREPTWRGQGWRDGAQDVRSFRAAVLEGRVAAPVSLAMRAAFPWPLPRHHRRDRLLPNVLPLVQHRTSPWRDRDAHPGRRASQSNPERAGAARADPSSRLDPSSRTLRSRDPTTGSPSPSRLDQPTCDTHNRRNCSVNRNRHCLKVVDRFRRARL